MANVNLTHTIYKKIYKKRLNGDLSELFWGDLLLRLTTINKRIYSPWDYEVKIKMTTVFQNKTKYSWYPKNKQIITFLFFP